jgi:uncharacterized protein YdaU (DUF1376 family)
MGAKLMAALPYMPLFVADYLADTADLSTAQHGAYMLLIMNYWQRGGPLPNDDARLAKITGLSARNWGQMRSRIEEFFESGTEFWNHARIDRELSRVADKSLKSKKAAQASVQRRFGERLTDGEADVEPTDTDKNREREKEEKGGGKPPTSYAFFGRTIRLKPNDLQRWGRTYHAIFDLDAELSTIDAWWQEQDAEERKHWFHRTMGMLNRKHQEILQSKKAGRDEPFKLTV